MERADAGNQLRSSVHEADWPCCPAAVVWATVVSLVKGTRQIHVRQEKQSIAGRSVTAAHTRAVSYAPSVRGRQRIWVV